MRVLSSSDELNEYNKLLKIEFITAFEENVNSTNHIKSSENSAKVSSISTERSYASLQIELDATKLDYKSKGQQNGSKSEDKIQTKAKTRWDFETSEL